MTEGKVHLIAGSDPMKTTCGKDIVGGMRVTDNKGDVTCEACQKTP